MLETIYSLSLNKELVIYNAFSTGIMTFKKK